MIFIEHIVEPVKLLLTWQPRLDQKPRTRRVIGEITPGLDGSVTF